MVPTVVFHIQPPAEYKRVHYMFHVGHLHPCQLSSPHLGPVVPLPPAPLPLDDTASIDYKVDNILDLHIGHFATQYLVK